MIHFALTGLPVTVRSAADRELAGAALNLYAQSPEWTAFAAWSIAELARRGIGADSPAWRVCQDLEARLGIAQGKVAEPGALDFEADLRGVLPDGWLAHAHEALDGRVPREVVESGGWREVADLVADTATGAPA